MRGAQAGGDKKHGSARLGGQRGAAPDLPPPRSRSCAATAAFIAAALRWNSTACSAATEEGGMEVRVSLLLDAQSYAAMLCPNPPKVHTLSIVVDLWIDALPDAWLAPTRGTHGS